MERSNSIARGKRNMDPMAAAEGGQPWRKRPALATSGIVEANEGGALHKFCLSLVPIFRKTVREELERTFPNIGCVKLGGRPSPKQLQGSKCRNLQLQFRSSLPLSLFTGKRIEGEQGAAIAVVLLDANSGHTVTLGPESSVKLDVVVLEGDFNNDADNWTTAEFENYVVKERRGKRPLLTGDLQVILKEGKGTLGELTFTDNSSWTRSRKFRLGLKVSSGHCEGIQIRGAKTEAFIVKDHRGESYKKHHPPALLDDVWRLEKIHKDGKFHKRLNDAEIRTVQDFLRHFVKDSEKLRSIVGNGMSKKMWDAVVEHAKTCELNGKCYVYYPDDTRNVGVVFNIIHELSGVIDGGQYCFADSIFPSQKGYVDSLVRKAYDNWMHVTEYESLVTLMKQNMPPSSCQTENVAGQQDYLNSFDQFTLPFLPASVPSMLQSMESDLALGDHYGSLVTRCSFPLQNQLISPSADVLQLLTGEIAPAPGPSQLSQSYIQGGGASNMTSFRGVDGLFLEEEMHLRSPAILGNEDMLLHLLNGGGLGPAYTNITEDRLPYSSAYMPISFHGDQSLPSGKAVVGWLKIKAALRWGIFIRKKAAKRRRAQLVELEQSKVVEWV